MNQNCETCAALWRDYAAATHVHVGIKAKLELARLNYDQPATQQLLKDAQAAAIERAERRRVLSDHERIAHPGGANAAGA